MQTSNMATATNEEETHPSTIVSARDVHKSFLLGDVIVQALRGITLDVYAGEMVAVMGPSGCGKTTMLNCLSGLDEFDSGEVFVEGANLRTMSDRQRTHYRANRMGFVFQTFNLLPVINAVENVELPLLVSGMRPAAARERAVNALEQVDLGDRLYHRPGELSGGQRQRVTIARALVNNPALVWADEPTGNLDQVASTEVLDLMRTLNQENGQTFVIVTHDRYVGGLCDRIVTMQDGEVISLNANGSEDVMPVAAAVSANEAGA